MSKHNLRDPKTGRFIASPTTAKNQLLMSTIMNDFAVIETNLRKALFFKEQENRTKKFDDTRARQQTYKERYTRPVQVRANKESVKNASSSIISSMGGVLKTLFAVIGIAGLLKMLIGANVGKYIWTFLKNAINSFVDILQKSFSIVKAVFGDFEVQNSLKTFIKSFFSLLGLLIVTTIGLGKQLIEDSEVLNSVKKVVSSLFNAVVEGFKAAYTVISELVNENIGVIKQAMFDIFMVIKDSIVTSLGFLQSIMASGIDPRITEGLKEIFVETLNFIKTLFTTEFESDGKKFTLGEKALEWLVELVAVTALIWYWQGKFREMGRQLTGPLDSVCDCMDMDLPDREKSRDGRRKRRIDRLKEQKKSNFFDDIGKKAGETLKSTKEAVGKAFNSVKAAFNSGWDKVKNSAKAMRAYAEKIARYVKAMAKSPSLRNKIMTKFGERFGKKAAESVAKKIALAAASLAAAPATAGFSLVVDIIMGALLLYDIYCIYDLLFVSSDGNKNDGGISSAMAAEVDRELGDSTTPTQSTPQTTPVATTAATTTAAFTTTSSSTPSASKPTTSSSGSGSVSPQATSSTSTAPSTTPQRSAPTSTSMPSELSIENRKVDGLGYKGPRSETVAALIHHTGGGSLDGAIQTLKSRKLSYHYLVDRNGNIVQILPDNLIAQHAGKTDKKPNLRNSNTVSIAMVAKDDSDVTPEQIAAAVSLEASLAKKYGFDPKNAWGHGEAGSHKDPKEGLTIAKAIRYGRGEQVAEAVATKSMKGMSPGIQTTEATTGKSIDTASNDLSSGMRFLEDMFLSSRPSFVNMSTNIKHETTTNKPAVGHREKQDKSFDLLIARHVS